MTFSPALAKIVADAKAKDGQARELLLNLIGNALERIHATPDTALLDYPQEAMV